jgi:hypothetical protein
MDFADYLIHTSSENSLVILSNTIPAEQKSRVHKGGDTISY